MAVYSRPHITISAATTIDGRIATKTGDSRISSNIDMIRLHRLRARTDAILVGRNTMLHDDPLLTVRYVSGQNPTRIILDPFGEILSNSQILTTCDLVPTILVLTSSADIKNQRRLAEFNVQIIQTGIERLDLQWLAHTLFQNYNIKTVLVEGGGATNWSFIQAGLFDEIILTISPHIAGGGISVMDGEGFARIHDSPSLHLKSIQPQGDEVVLHYTRNTIQHSGDGSDYHRT
ncbi:MAG: 2,5-diamino-6-(ribosylamino)-4(3H)-pyrimidinone 5'-phosphate reductase [Cenarchaeum sp. SB0661_bin_35]|nr:2,5-diamino-6-(ribosylamino)-4(3H)-pyrimidinone 5'-phosphate reductase [Cenarchaeum sp. SB0667_bin_13]MXY37623.1 2,5-diamino-6-(ribosylamino)-4(3H)-pyrimidinone 5'-phosphate reductase [Cenarchaeum sp. SB0664_bin_35]MXZ93834.1 2,5-diamino-6-(ribosylamino)-4(3H)-pyrimidinone 5'-phosphate reductase [Cenarchaeum sp. SB0666_bin_15]MYB46772.1 2,5-diamino-6-(ribosylamino)-4(3H)-pyrimidinone 5'-phosphate reductase [Cenarchaeum sp. SB0662_bin_33]MYC79941.1 2,5-diamino-6-(ribosylamino)-4(3H)-pyrimidin